MIKNNPIAG